MADLKFTSNADTLILRLKKMQNCMDPTDPGHRAHFLEMGMYMVDQIKAHARKGQQYWGAAFPGYSLRYAKWKAEYGEKRQTSRPDLYLDGLLMGSIMPHIIQDGSVRIGAGADGLFHEHAELMEVHTKGIGVPRRDPVGFTDRDRKRLNEMHHKYLIQRLSK